MNSHRMPLINWLSLAAAACAVTALAACTSIDYREPTWALNYAPGIASGNRIIADFHSWIGVDGKRRASINQGIDISGSAGQPIIAIADGLVVEVHAEKCRGPTVAIDHGRIKSGRKLIALYGYVGDVLVEEGQTVSRGDVIARLGNNRRAFGCVAGVRHLHLHLGSERRLNKQSAWGYAYFLKDWNSAMNPHLLWADSPFRVTCFDESKEYAQGTITYPVPCRGLKSADAAGPASE